MAELAKKVMGYFLDGSLKGEAQWLGDGRVLPICPLIRIPIRPEVDVTESPSDDPMDACDVQCEEYRRLETVSIGAIEIWKFATKSS